MKKDKCWSRDSNPRPPSSVVKILLCLEKRKSPIIDISRMEFVPSKILIVGSGVFGLSTAYALCRNLRFKSTEITLIDRCPFPAPDSASIDTSRIIRDDYAHSAYAKLASEASPHWRGGYAAANIYHETGFCLSAEQGQDHYVKAALDNVRKLEHEDAIETYGSRDELRDAVGTGGASGTMGYLNKRSGWADAEAAMRFLRRKVEDLQRVRFVTATVTKLLLQDGGKKVAGVVLDNGNQITADLTILAVGGWTPMLLDMRGLTITTGQVLAYLEISDEEAVRLSKSPVQMNLSTGMFMIPPPHPSEHIPLPGQPRRLYLKIARHGHGYLNPKEVKYPASSSSSSSSNSPTTAEVSLPASGPSASHPAPQEGLDACRTYLKEILSPNDPITTRPWISSRICHYADTPTGDFLVDYHPDYQKSLFVLTGDNGHAFKFLPVLGEKVVECLVGECEEEYSSIWAWRRPAKAEDWQGDGSRGGKKGMVLDEELRRSRQSKL